MSNTVYHRDETVHVLLQRDTGEEGMFRFQTVGRAIKPARFGQAAKNAIATLYAQVDRITLVQGGHKEHRLGGGFRAVTWFTDYERNAKGKWVIAKSTSVTAR